ncbi:MAG: HD domain-containing protein [Blastochloris sp.]|nr:HD domain-containing protein [Blastochloris sp.]
MPRPESDHAIAAALARLTAELSPDLVYHSLAHTRDEVLPAVERLAYQEGVIDEPLLLLRTAAAYHDIGFVQQRHDHEQASVAIARAMLPEFGYTPAHLAVIEGLIWATKLPQMPHTLPEQILADADLDSLGRLDFLSRSLALRTELAASGTVIALPDWYAQQLAFVRQHRYFTPSARRLRDPGK